MSDRIDLTLEFPAGQWLDLPPPVDTPEINDLWQQQERLMRIQSRENWLNEPMPTVPFVFKD